MRWAWIVAMFGCGRVAFDRHDPDSGGTGSADACAAVAGHDEDSDGIDDACDICPHRTDATQLDDDADGVGNACDPNAGLIDRIAFFDPFVQLDASWRAYGGGTYGVSNDQLVIDARAQTLYIERSIVVGTDYIELGGRFEAVAATARQITLSFDSDPVGTYYCELYDSPGNPNFALTQSFDDMVYTQLTISPADPVEPGPLMLGLHTDSTTATCQTTHPAMQPTISGAVPPANAAAVNGGIYLVGIAVRLDYFIHIRAD